MPQWKQIDKGLIEIGDNGLPTGKVHNCTYHEANGHVMKVIHNSDGTSSAEIHQPRVHVLYDTATGDIVGMHKGFLMEAELGNPKPVAAKLKDGTDAECMEIVYAMPADFAVDTYKVSKAGELVKKI